MRIDKWLWAARSGRRPIALRASTSADTAGPSPQIAPRQQPLKQTSDPVQATGSDACRKHLRGVKSQVLSAARRTHTEASTLVLLPRLAFAASTSPIPRPANQRSSWKPPNRLRPQAGTGRSLAVVHAPSCRESQTPTAAEEEATDHTTLLRAIQGAGNLPPLAPPAGYKRPEPGRLPAQRQGAGPLCARGLLAPTGSGQREHTTPRSGKRIADPNGQGAQSRQRDPEDDHPAHQNRPA